jgi:hypothetical protein
MSLESTRENNKEQINQICSCRVEGRKNVDESNQYRREKWELRRGEMRWEKIYKLKLKIYRPFTFE